MEASSSITPKRPLLSRDRMVDSLIDISPLTDYNYRSSQSSLINLSIPSHHTDIHTFIVNHPSSRSVSTIDDNDENCDVPMYIPKKARPAPASTWKAPLPMSKSSTMLKSNLDPLTFIHPIDEGLKSIFHFIC